MVWDSRPSAHRRGEHADGVPIGQYAGMAHDRRFRLLQTRFRRLAVGLVGSFLGWYFLYISLSAFARDFMARPVIGNINVALLLGVLQFVSTFVLAWRYTRYARRMLDPLSAQLREEADVRQAESERVERVMAERDRIENWTPPPRNGQARPSRAPSWEPSRAPSWEHDSAADRGWDPWRDSGEVR